MSTDSANNRDRSASTRERLLAAAVEAFATSGFAGTTTRDIASRAGMSPAAVYVHHATKEDLLFEISRRGHQSAVEIIEGASRRSQDPVVRVRTMVEEFSRWHAVNSRVGRIVQYEFDALTPEHRAEIAEYRRAIEALMREALEAGVEAGVMTVSDTKGTSLALLSLSIDLVRWYHPGGSTTPDDIAALHGELAVRMVGATA
ncbi:TetR/AcrR family transcriptional regulator [Aeromicrobium duanguangcaii]|uniref:TetR/AcrR family transcriptional regulator n=1 Tax=Aeromicrobium duanguangcaii TaxID=2968086 RepID=A0ABY5KDX5_9ACTN|nr:TetR/AcrR family transcriptional regulator [Aeromicrobium duanguangcaii]MCD9154602.1 TetR/AcrR family transcriptional regulator [Aeromicrobium duanguangcaii]MCL3838720.1 TetR/AcrR family transcriptional regulator [Aeromicrobium duanguangcaii]UUI67983.1 TetR/AcrR family transcriptional regulator [Aeromicrobium duanguangcaii]